MQRNIIGHRIEELRKEKDETQQQLADAVSVKRETINQWESGTRQIKAQAIFDLAQHFGVSSDYLLGLTDAKSTNSNIRQICDYTGLDESAIEQLHSQLNRFHKGSIVLLNYLLNNNTILRDLCEYYSSNFWDKSTDLKYGALLGIQKTPPRSKGHLLGNLLNDLPLDSDRFYKKLYKENPQLSELMGCTYIENELREYRATDMAKRLYKKFERNIKMEEIDKVLFDFLSVTGNIEILQKLVNLNKLEERISTDLANDDTDRTTQIAQEDEFDYGTD